MLFYKIKDKEGNEHIILIIAEDVKVSINGKTRFVHYVDKNEVEGVVFGSDTYDLVNFNNDGIDMHVGIDCTTAESFIINSDLFNSLEKEIYRLPSVNGEQERDNIRKNVPFIYLKDGSESKELLGSIDRFIASVQSSVNSHSAKAYTDESQSKSIQGWLYKYDYGDGDVHCVRIISKTTYLHVSDFTTHGNEMGKWYGYAVGTTETGLIKIKHKDNDSYAYVR